MLEITEPSVLIRINQSFSPRMDREKLYDYTRGFWRMDLDNANKAKYAFSIYKGEIKEVYEINQWFRVNSTEPDFRQDDTEELGKRKNRLYFEGKVAPYEIRDKYRNESVRHYFKKGNANPFIYINI